MQLFVRGLEETTTLNVESRQLIEDVKDQIEKKQNISSSEQRLLYSGKQLENGMRISDYDIQEEATIDLAATLLGGAKKRKKKNYTTPKKTKHKHRKVKLGVLKYYKVDDNGKITRQRRECPGEDCGAGVFMANHFDRQYCGRCHLTFVFNKPQE